jgi:hypothetical protein
LLNKILVNSKTKSAETIPSEISSAVGAKDSLFIFLCENFRLSSAFSKFPFLASAKANGSARDSAQPASRSSLRRFHQGGSQPA